jgi:hypothetical protein
MNTSIKTPNSSIFELEHSIVISIVFETSPTPNIRKFGQNDRPQLIAQTSNEVHSPQQNNTRDTPNLLSPELMPFYANNAPAPPLSKLNSPPSKKT